METIAQIIVGFVILCFLLLLAALPLSLAFVMGMLMWNIWKTREL